MICPYNALPVCLFLWFKITIGRQTSSLRKDIHEYVQRTPKLLLLKLFHSFFTCLHRYVYRVYGYYKTIQLTSRHVLIKWRVLIELIVTSDKRTRSPIYDLCLFFFILNLFIKIIIGKFFLFYYEYLGDGKNVQLDVVCFWGYL